MSKFLRKIYEALRNDGKFLINVNNATRTTKRIIETGQQDQETKVYRAEATEQLSNGLAVITIDIWSPETNRWQMERTWEESGEKKSYKTDVRLFTIGELTSLLENNGFRVTRKWGDFDGNEHNPLNSKTIILLARKIRKTSLSSTASTAAQKKTGFHG